MIIRKDSIKQIDFSGLKIYDYTEGMDLRSSFAVIHVHPNQTHSKSWSTRSDKFYYVINGQIQFFLEGEDFILSEGDFCVVLKGQRFAYKNINHITATLILVHTPSFDINFEKFE